MKRDLPSYVVRLRGVLYFKRRGWPTHKFEAQELGPAFYAEYTAILNHVAPAPVSSSVSGLIDRYMSSPDFEAKKPRTRADYTKFLNRLRENAGDIPVKSIERKHVAAWRNQLAQSNSAHYANYFVRVLSLLLEFGCEHGILDANPAKGTKSLKYEKQKREPWPKGMIEAARAARPHGDRIRLLFELLYDTGQRVGDVLSMEWADIRGGKIKVVQNKTSTPLFLPIGKHLQECQRFAERRGATILTAHMKDTPWSYRGAHDAMMKLRREIGAEKYDIHAIRHTVASELGAVTSDEEAMAVTGHQSASMFAHYAGQARQVARAERAQNKRK